MFTLFSFLLQLVGVIGLLFSLFVFYHVARPQKGPADTSNRINKIRLLWFCLTRENLFVDTFPWLKNDELENVTK
ncbi:hypothetical protein [Xanthomonas phage RTH11]|nr:hypothetical protein [Xanthomonas phage RTH11]